MQVIGSFQQYLTDKSAGSCGREQGETSRSQSAPRRLLRFPCTTAPPSLEGRSPPETPRLNSRAPDSTFPDHDFAAADFQDWECRFRCHRPVRLPSVPVASIAAEATYKK